MSDKEIEDKTKDFLYSQLKDEQKENLRVYFSKEEKEKPSDADTLVAQISLWGRLNSDKTY